MSAVEQRAVQGGRGGSSAWIAGSSATSQASATATCKSCYAPARYVSMASVSRPMSRLTRRSDDPCVSSACPTATTQSQRRRRPDRHPDRRMPTSLRAMILHEDDTLIAFNKPVRPRRPGRQQDQAAHRRHAPLARTQRRALSPGAPSRPRHQSGLLVVAKTAVIRRQALQSLSASRRARSSTGPSSPACPPSKMASSTKPLTKAPSRGQA